MGTTIASTAIAAALWWNLLLKLRRFRGRPRAGAQQANIITLAFVAAGITLLDPPVYTVVDTLTGVPNLARLLGNSLGLIGAWAAEPVAVQLSERHSSRRPWERRSVLVALLSVMTWLFLCADTQVSDPFTFVERYAATPYMGEYRFLLLGYTGLCFLRLFLLWLRRLRPAADTRRRVHRRLYALQTAGWLCGVLYCVQECIWIALRRLGIVAAGAYSLPLAYFLLVSCFALALSDNAFAAAAHLARYRAYRMLYPLWRDLYAVAPGIALDPPRTPRDHLAAFFDVGFRLYRRTTEIQDGILALRPYTARDDRTPDAHTQARTIAQAIRATGGNGEHRVASATPEGGGRDAAPARGGTGLPRGDRISYWERGEPRGNREGEIIMASTEIPRSPADAVARFCTEVFAPAPVSLVTLATVAWRFSASPLDALRWIALSVTFVAALPMGWLTWQVRRGNVTDIHVRRREQRGPIIALFLASWAIGVALLALLGAPPQLIATILAGFATLFVAGAITTRWKVSIHVGVAAGVIAVFAQLFGPPMLLLAPLVPLLAWARVRVRDHTVGQVVGGAAIGAISSSLSFALIAALLW